MFMFETVLTEYSNLLKKTVTNKTGLRKAYRKTRSAIKNKCSKWRAHYTYLIIIRGTRLVVYVGESTASRVLDCNPRSRNELLRELSIFDLDRVVVYTGTKKACHREEQRLIAEHHTFIRDPLYSGYGAIKLVEVVELMDSSI
jgi:hypothetical protein